MLALLAPVSALLASNQQPPPWFVVVWFAFIGFACVLQIPLIGLWIWMIVDCARNETDEKNERLVWILVIVLTSWIGGLIYFFARRKRRIRELGH